jgi:hypothetical protein
MLSIIATIGNVTLNPMLSTICRVNSMSCTFETTLSSQASVTNNLRMSCIANFVIAGTVLTSIVLPNTFPLNLDCTPESSDC